MVVQRGKLSMGTVRATATKSLPLLWHVPQGDPRTKAGGDDVHTEEPIGLGVSAQVG